LYDVLSEFDMQFIDTNLKTDSVQTLKKDMVELCYCSSLRSF